VIIRSECKNKHYKHIHLTLGFHHSANNVIFLSTIGGLLQCQKGHPAH